MSDETKNALLSPKATLPAGAIMSILTAFGGYIYSSQTQQAETLAALNDMRHSQELRFKDIENAQNQTNMQLQSYMRDRWKKTDMKIWASQLDGANPELTVPPVE